MKLYIFCAVILILLFSICFFSTFTVKSITKQTEDGLQQVLTLYESERYTEGYKQIQQTDDFWNRNNNILGMLLYHSLIDDVTTELAMLKAYAMTDNSDELYSSCAELFTLLERIREMEYPYLKNIL